MKLTDLFHGGGSRRKSDESWDDLQRQLSNAQHLLKPMKDAVRNTCPAAIHGPFWVIQQAAVPCPWCEIRRLQAREASQVLVVAAPPAGPPLIPAAADAPGFEPLPEAPLRSADNQLLPMPDAPRFPAEVEAADVNAETQQVVVSDLWRAIGENETTMLPEVDVPSSAPHLERARANVPPKPAYPPAHPPEQQLVTWRPKLPGADPLGHDDLKAEVTTGGLPQAGIRVQLAKTN